MSTSRVFTKYRHLIDNYHTLQKGDIFLGRLPLRRGEEHILVDLCHRGLKLIPSALSQLASRSKVLQARLFTSWMIPPTIVAYDAHHLLEQITAFEAEYSGQVIVKMERKNGGIGILLFRSIEDVYNHAVTASLPFPFVLQPFVTDATDIRVVMLGDYIEAYTRQNPHSFRNNLHCGGVSAPHNLSAEEHEICQSVIKRGDFPYGHLDLLLTSDGRPYLLEINLRGGIRGARISTKEYKVRSAAIEQQLMTNLML